MIRAYRALITHGGTPAGTSEYYEWLANPLTIAGAGILYGLEIVVADMILVSSSQLPAHIAILT